MGHLKETKPKVSRSPNLPTALLDQAGFGGTKKAFSERENWEMFSLLVNGAGIVLPSPVSRETVLFWLTLSVHEIANGH